MKKQNGLGRVDLLLSRCLQEATNSLDRHLGTSGSWDRVGDAVNFVIDAHVPKKKVEIPDEARILAKLMGL